MSALRDAALAHAYRGWPVFPCRPRAKEPLVAGGFKAATTDEVQLREWWRAWPTANIGYATGALVVVEIDGAEGAATMATLRAEHEWPETLTAMSGRPGLHFYFVAPALPIRNAPQDGKSPRSLGIGIAVRGQGGYVIVPPSVHPTGRRYEWINRTDPAPLPSWMVERLRPPAPAPRKPLPRRDKDLTRYAAAALDAEVEAVELAPLGTLNDTLNRAAYALGRLVPTISEGTIADALLAAALNNGHPERGARATIRSGLTAGMARRGR